MICRIIIPWVFKMFVSNLVRIGLISNHNANWINVRMNPEIEQLKIVGDYHQFFLHKAPELIQKLIHIGMSFAISRYRLKIYHLKHYIRFREGFQKIPSKFKSTLYKTIRIYGTNLKRKHKKRKRPQKCMLLIVF